MKQRAYYVPCTALGTGDTTDKVCAFMELQFNVGTWEALYVMLGNTGVGHGRLYFPKMTTATSPVPQGLQGDLATFPFS